MFLSSIIVGWIHEEKLKCFVQVFTTLIFHCSTEMFENGVDVEEREVVHHFLFQNVHGIFKWRWERCLCCYNCFYRPSLLLASAPKLFSLWSVTLVCRGFMRKLWCGIWYDPVIFSSLFQYHYLQNLLVVRGRMKLTVKSIPRVRRLDVLRKPVYFGQ